MKRIGLALLLFLLLLPAGCTAVQHPPIPGQSPAIEVLVPQPRQKARETPAPAPSHEMPASAPWLDQRNKELREIIRRYRPHEPETQVESELARMTIDPEKPMVALTFDDGPVPGVTDKILDVLEEYNARATFFICGWRLEKQENRDIIFRAAAQGCEIGNHTWSHHKLVGQNYVSVRYEIENTNDAVFETIGVKPRCFRPPGGVNTFEATSVTRDNGMSIVLWAQSGNVYETDPKKIAQNVQKQIVNGKELHDGDIILLHDTKDAMVEAVKIMIPQLIAKGYQLVTAWELLNCYHASPVPGGEYACRGNAN